MPYDSPGQATAAFLNIKRKKGMRKAKEFGRKHRGDLRRDRSYTPPGRR